MTETASTAIAEAPPAKERAPPASSVRRGRRNRRVAGFSRLSGVAPLRVERHRRSEDDLHRLSHRRPCERDPGARGDRLQAGQPLLALETGDLEAQLLQAQAQLEQAQANLEKLEKGRGPRRSRRPGRRPRPPSPRSKRPSTGREARRFRAHARLIALQVAVDKAQLDADRAHRLISSGAISQAESDNADAALRGPWPSATTRRSLDLELKNAGEE